MNDPSARPPTIRLPKDARTDGQRRQARRALERQVAQLEQRLASNLEPSVIEQLIGDRAAREDLRNVRVLDQQHQPVLVASDEVLVRAADLPAGERRRLGARPVESLDGRVLVVAGRDPADRSQAQFRPNFVTPMGIVMKSLCGPEPTNGTGLARATGAGTALRVAVIDTGIAASGRTDGWLPGIETPANEDLLDDLPPAGFLDLGAGHGTFVAGIVQQLAPDADIRVYRALATDGLGTEVDVADAMMRAVADGAQILNLSLGLETTDDEPPIALQAAVELIAERSPDVLIVAAAGNGGRNRKCWPGAFEQVTAVAGLTVQMRPARWSSHGTWVDCSTIGEGVLSTYVVGTENPLVDPKGPDRFCAPNPWALWTGTSFAAPQITGAVAQLAQRWGLAPRAALDRLLRRRRRHRYYGRKVRLLRPA